MAPNFPSLTMKKTWLPISNDFKPDKHCSDVVKKANKLVGFIGITFEYKSENSYPYTK